MFINKVLDRYANYSCISKSSLYYMYISNTHNFVCINLHLSHIRGIFMINRDLSLHRRKSQTKHFRLSQSYQ